MRRPTIRYSDPVDAARAVLTARLGDRTWPHIADYQLAELAQAILATADSVSEVSKVATTATWQTDQGYRDYVRGRLRNELLDAVTRTGRVPTALPAEEIAYMREPAIGADRTAGAVPAEEFRGVLDPLEWPRMVVRLWCPARTPAVDREKAVRVGLLAGPEW